MNHTRVRRSKAALAGAYGYYHKKIRDALIALWQPGDPCTRCGLPMWGPTRKINLGHNDEGTGYTGLEHERCNKRDGAVRGNKQRAGTATRHSRTW